MEDKDFDLKKYQALWHKEQSQLQSQQLISREEIHRMIDSQKNQPKQYIRIPMWLQMVVVLSLLLLGIVGMIFTWSRGTLSWMLTIVLLTMFSMVLVVMLMNHPHYWQRVVGSTFVLVLLIGIVVWLLPMPQRESLLIESPTMVYTSVGSCDGVDRAICNMEECNAERYVQIAQTILYPMDNNVQK